MNTRYLEEMTVTEVTRVKVDEEYDVIFEADNPVTM